MSRYQAFLGGQRQHLEMDAFQPGPDAHGVVAVDIDLVAARDQEIGARLVQRVVEPVPHLHVDHIAVLRVRHVAADEAEDERVGLRLLRTEEAAIRRRRQVPGIAAGLGIDRKHGVPVLRFRLQAGEVEHAGAIGVAGELLPEQQGALNRLFGAVARNDRGARRGAFPDQARAGRRQAGGNFPVRDDQRVGSRFPHPHPEARGARGGMADDARIGEARIDPGPVRPLAVKVQFLFHARTRLPPTPAVTPPDCWMDIRSSAPPDEAARIAATLPALILLSSSAGACRALPRAKLALNLPAGETNAGIESRRIVRSDRNLGGR
jgi:hypothetical protein